MEREDQEEIGGGGGRQRAGGERATNVYGKPLLWVLLLLEFFCRCRPHCFRGPPAAGAGRMNNTRTQHDSKVNNTPARHNNLRQPTAKQAQPKFKPNLLPCHCSRDGCVQSEAKIFRAT